LFADFSWNLTATILQLSPNHGALQEKFIKSYSGVWLPLVALQRPLDAPWLADVHLFGPMYGWQANYAAFFKRGQGTRVFLRKTLPEIGVDEPQKKKLPGRT
jgi:hypothetical protein